MSHDAPKTVDFIYLVKIRHETQTHELYAREKVVEHHEEVKTFYDESTALSFFGRLVQDQTETHATRIRPRRTQRGSYRFTNFSSIKAAESSNFSQCSTYRT
jgi:hypothetical protein